MPYIQPFNSVITTTKKNNRYYGPTESAKIASYLSEIQCDINTLFSEINSIRAEFDALAASYFVLGTNVDAFYNMKARMNNLLDTINNRIYLQSN